jgi:FecR protein
MSALALRSSHHRSALRLILLSFLTVVFAASALAESHVRIVRLSYVDGDVEIDKGDGRGFISAFMNMPVVHQSKLWARDGIAEVEFENGSSIRLTPDTIVAFNDLSSDADGRLFTKVELTQGTAYFDLRHRDPDTFELQLGRERVEVPQSAHFRVDSESHEFEIAVLGGQVQVANGRSDEVGVKKGETVHLDIDNADTYQLAKGIDTENYDTWDHERSSGHDQVVSTATVWNGTSSSSNQNLTGSYPYIPGYGFGWGSTTLLVGNSCGYSGFGSPFGYGYPWGLSPYSVGYASGWCPSYYPNYYSNFYNGYGGYSTYILYPVPGAPLNYRPHPGPRPRPLPANSLATNTETRVTTLPPARRVVIDNDVLAQRFPHASAAPSGNATVSVPANGFASGGTTPVVPVVATGTVVRAPVPAAVPIHPVVRAPMPSAMPHVSAAPPMRSSGSMGRMSGARMSSPSMSGGGMRMSGASMGGGGGHSSGGGHR